MKARRSSGSLDQSKLTKAPQHFEHVSSASRPSREATGQRRPEAARADGGALVQVASRPPPPSLGAGSPSLAPPLTPSLQAAGLTGCPPRAGSAQCAHVGGVAIYSNGHAVRAVPTSPVCEPERGHEGSAHAPLAPEALRSRRASKERPGRDGPDKPHRFPHLDFHLSVPRRLDRRRLPCALS